MPSDRRSWKAQTTYHELGTMTDDLGLVFWCDVCNLSFRNKPHLDVHIRGCHAEVRCSNTSNEDCTSLVSEIK